MNRLKEHFQVIIAFAAVIGIVLGGMNYFAKADDLKLVEMRLDQKIVGDQLYETQKAIWALVEKNVRHTSDCSQWPDARDREQYTRG